MYRIALDNGHETLGYTAGKMRRYRIKILPGDRITVELSPYDLARGRIETTGEPVERIAEAVGFGDAENMRRAFIRLYGQPPQSIRRATRS